MVIQLLTSHASVRKYKDVALTSDQVKELVIAGQHAASSHFVQAYSVIHVTDPQKREQLAELSKNPKQMLTAGAVLIFCADYYRLERAAAMHEQTIDYSYAENLLVGSIDVALFAQNVAIAAESKGYGICYIGGVRNAPHEISELLQLPKGVVPMFGMSMGVPDEANEVKPRLPVEAILHENDYNTTVYDTALPKYDETMRNYYANRGSNQKNSEWSSQMAHFLKTPKRTYMKDFLQKQGFNLH